MKAADVVRKSRDGFVDAFDRLCEIRSQTMNDLEIRVEDLKSAGLDFTPIESLRVSIDSLLLSLLGEFSKCRQNLDAVVEVLNSNASPDDEWGDDI